MRRPLRIQLAPSVSTAISIRQSLSLQSAPLSLASNTPLIRDLMIPENPPGTRPRKPDLKFALPKSNAYGILGAQSCPLYCAAIHPGPAAHPPRSPHRAQLAALPICLTTPCPTHSLLAATPMNGCTLQVDASGLQRLPRRRTPLYFGTQGVLCRPIGHRYAEVWSAGCQRGRPLLTRPLSVAFRLRVLLEMKTRMLRALLILAISSIWSKSLSVKSNSTPKCAPLLITSDAHASAAMRAPA